VLQILHCPVFPALPYVSRTSFLTSHELSQFLCYVDRCRIIAQAMHCGAAYRRTGIRLAEACVEGVLYAHDSTSYCYLNE
jgi:hypothetical protein